MTLYHLCSLIAAGLLAGTAYVVWTALPYPPLPWLFGLPGVLLAIGLWWAGAYASAPGNPKRFGETPDD
ncbi:MAG TPA: hypothetical protein VES73_03865 [Lamprocystis sp. (in: g-proteobacteria)]|nr:hypothetical protein [Lamprocystis sp. (in: g-proteobacteria)]